MTTAEAIAAEVDAFQLAWSALRVHLGLVDDHDFADLLGFEREFGELMDRAARGRA